ncbi:hypothetical protein A6C13_23090 [Salmonella enterica]|nr:hypothetical protein [Salmonella enterica]
MRAGNNGVVISADKRIITAAGIPQGGQIFNGVAVTVNIRVGRRENSIAVSGGVNFVALNICAIAKDIIIVADTGISATD